MKNTILQINATIIAGLLIFLTIQSVTTDSVFDLVYRYKLLAAEDAVLVHLQDDVNDHKKIYENVDENGTVILKPDSNTVPGELSFSIPQPLPVLEKQELQISQMSEENFKERVKLQAKLDMQRDLPPAIYLHSNPNLVVSVLIIPFIASIMTELFSWRMTRSKHDPNIISIVFLVIGLSIMLGVFIIFGIYHVNVN